MNNIISEIKSFYFYYYASAEIKPEDTSAWTIKNSSCTRSDFASATFDALIFLTQNIALAVISGIALTFTLGLRPSIKASFFKNIHEGIVHAGSIPVSIVGMISPSLINKHFLNIKPHECKVPTQPGTLTESATFVGGIVLRKRVTFE